jgi:hypothetical protein
MNRWSKGCPLGSGPLNLTRIQDTSPQEDGQVVLKLRCHLNTFTGLSSVAKAWRVEAAGIAVNAISEDPDSPAVTPCVCKAVNAEGGLRRLYWPIRLQFLTFARGPRLPSIISPRNQQPHIKQHFFSSLSWFVGGKMSSY